MQILAKITTFILRLWKNTTDFIYKKQNRRNHLKKKNYNSVEIAYNNYTAYFIVLSSKIKKNIKFVERSDRKSYASNVAISLVKLGKEYR